MLELLDLQDLLPYLFSVSLLLVLRYFYLLFLYGDLHITWLKNDNYDYSCAFHLIPAPHGCESPSSFCRLVRRREAPDEDSSDCCSSCHDVYSYKRGGALCRQKDSLSIRKERSFSL